MLRAPAAEMQGADKSAQDRRDIGVVDFPSNLAAPGAKITKTVLNLPREVEKLPRIMSFV